MIYLPDAEHQDVVLAGAKRSSARVWSRARIRSSKPKNAARSWRSSAWVTKTCKPRAAKAGGGRGVFQAGFHSAWWRLRPGDGLSCGPGGCGPGGCGPLGCGPGTVGWLRMRTGGRQRIPPGYVAGVTAPMYGMPMCGTPIGLAGPPHIPLGVPAGLQEHSITNYTHYSIPEPVHDMKIKVAEVPGLSYPKPPHRAVIIEATPTPPVQLHQPASIGTKKRRATTAPARN